MNNNNNNKDGSVIYISYEGKDSDIKKKMRYLYELFPNYVFIMNPRDTFGNYDDDVYLIDKCLWLLDSCDEMWILNAEKLGEFQKEELNFCKEHKIPYFKVIVE